MDEDHSSTVVTNNSRTKDDNNTISLSLAPIGSHCLIQGIVHANDGLMNRLCFFGLCIADEIVVERKSLLGQTFYISILNFPLKTRIAIDKTQADNIKVLLI